MRKFIYLLLSAALLLGALYADLSVTINASWSPPDIIRLSERKVVLVFEVGGTSTFRSITVENNSASVPFARDGVRRVELYTNDTGTGTLLASAEFTITTAQGGVPSWIANFGNQSSGIFSLVYYIASNAKFTPEDSTTQVKTNVNLVSA
ncbi:MAG: hypothetical protein LBQ83_04550, partial [Candidatus Margulisbacteria bacterium]|nr:hypothetical protein [Candidatus Margulisiibacteriota bacterium]